MAPREDPLRRRDQEGRRQLPDLRRDRARRRSSTGSARIKGAAARVNAELGCSTRARRARSPRPPTQVAAGEHDDQFPIDVFQTGSGTSSNMNANEVIAALAGEGAHPNDHVNMGQSSNDVFPSAPCTSPRWTRRRTRCCRRSSSSSARSTRKAKRVQERRQVRPHAPHGRRPRDARPGVRRLRGADPPRPGARRGRARRTSRQIPLGGTATGTGLNTHPKFAEQRPPRPEQRHRS